MWSVRRSCCCSDRGWGLWAWQVGNSPDFNCSADAEALARCQAHFSQWCIMKAPLILGNNLPEVDATTLSGG